MRNLKLKEAPLFDVTQEEVIKFYHFVYAFVLDLKRRKGTNVTHRHRSAVNEPGWAAAEILYLALYGYTKKTKFAKKSQYLKWKNAPYTLEKRIMSLLGIEGKKFVKEKEEELLNIKKELKIEGPATVNTLSYNLRTDDQEIQIRMQRYIEDFDLHSAVDIDILKNLVQTQVLIETAHKKLSEGKPTNFDLKSLATQLKDYAILLGLSKKDRLDFGTERKKGSIAELAGTYEQTLQEYASIEQEFLIEELNMLLDKHERLNDDGERELSLKAFRTISGGYTLEEALSMTNRKRKNAKRQKSRPSNT